MTITPDSSNSEINQEDKLVISGNDQLLLTEGLGKKQILEQLSLTTNIIKGDCFDCGEQFQAKNCYHPKNFIIYEFSDYRNCSGYCHK